MLKIKLTRRGKKDQAQFRIVVQEAKSRRDGKYTDLLGTYNPTTQPSSVVIDTIKYETWISKGAKPTPTIEALYQKQQSQSKNSAKPTISAKKSEKSTPKKASDSKKASTKKS